MIGLLTFLNAALGACEASAAFVDLDRAPTLCLQVADTEAERRKGLMHLNSLPLDRGMLFIFEKEGPHPFWMRNTWIPLDIIFLTADNRVQGVVHSAAPGSEQAVGAEFQAKAVIEVNGGFCERYGVERGRQVKWARSSSDKK